MPSQVCELETIVDPIHGHRTLRPANAGPWKLIGRRRGYEEILDGNSTLTRGANGGQRTLKGIWPFV